MNQKIDASEIKQCFHCRKGVMTGNAPVFYELTIQSCVVDINNIRRMHGMEMAFGALAGVFSPDNSIATRVDVPTKHWICMDCGTGRSLPAAVYLTEES